MLAWHTPVPNHRAPPGIDWVWVWVIEAGPEVQGYPQLPRKLEVSLGYMRAREKRRKRGREGSVEEKRKEVLLPQ